MLQRYDAERDEAQCNRIAVAAWGGESKTATKQSEPLPNARKQMMTQRDIMRKYTSVTHNPLRDGYMYNGEDVPANG